MNPRGDAGYTEFDVPYARLGDRELVLRVTKPAGQGSGPFPVLLDFHGGAWTHFDHRVDLAWCRALAQQGVLCASVQFRLAPEHPWPAFIADARAALRWLTAHGRSIGADVSRLGTIGGSTGGFMSILLAMCPRTENETPTPAIDTPDDLAPALPRVAIGFYPILDVAGRYDMVRERTFSPLTRWLRERVGPPRETGHMKAPVDRLEKLYALKARGGMTGALAGRAANGVVGTMSRLPFVQMAVYEELVRNHEGAFTSREAMQEASPLARVREGRVQNRPAILVIQGLEDINVTPAMTEAFAGAWRAQGGTIETEFPPGFPHAFASIPSPQSDHAIARSLEFLGACGLLGGRGAGAAATRVFA